jgi:hypothetical protein
MKSASAYTNRVRVTSEAKNRKVEQVGSVATNIGLLQATLPCSPDFSNIQYRKICTGFKSIYDKRIEIGIVYNNLQQFPGQGSAVAPPEVSLRGGGAVGGTVDEIISG